MFAEKEHKPQQNSASSHWENLPLQKKLEIGAKDDPQEKEADEVAEKIVSDSTLNAKGSGDGNIRRTEKDEEKKVLTMKEETAAPKQTMKEETYSRVHKIHSEEKPLVMTMKDESATWKKRDKERNDELQQGKWNLQDEPVRKMGEDDPQTWKMGDDQEVPVRRMGEDDPQTRKMGDDQEVPVRRMGEDANGATSATSAFQQQLNTTKGSGNPLPENIQRDFAQSTGNDLSDVKVHTDSTAHEMSAGINAKAFTHGNDIYFKQGQYNPSTDSGKQLIYHEAQHTVQQGGVKRKVQRKPDDVFSIYQRISKRFKIIIDKYGLEESFTNLFSTEEMASIERLLTAIEPKLVEGNGNLTSILFQGLRYDAWDGKNRLVIIDASPEYKNQKHQHAFDMRGTGLIFKYFRSEKADEAFKAYSENQTKKTYQSAEYGTAFPIANEQSSASSGFKTLYWNNNPVLLSVLKGSAPVLGYNISKKSGSQGSHIQILHDNLMTLARKWTIISDEEMKLNLFGPSTRQAVLNYQNKKGINPASGNAGPKTLRQMDDDLAQQDIDIGMQNRVRESAQSNQKQKTDAEKRKTENHTLTYNSNQWVIYLFPEPDASALSKFGIDASQLTFTYIDRGKIEDMANGGCRFEVKYKTVFMGTIDLQRDERGDAENKLFNDAYSGKNPAFRNLLENGKAFRFANSTSIDQKGDPDFISILISAGYAGVQTGFSAEDLAFAAYMTTMQTVVDIGGMKMSNNQKAAEARLNGRAGEVITKQALPIKVRLAIFFQKLISAEPVNNAEAALKLISDILNTVEDTYSGIPKVENPGLKFTGRMYPPFADNINRNQDGSIFAKTRGHDINIKSNGSFTILERNSGKIEINKPGAIK